ncbi:class I SAM-dependent methyltransferase [Nostoc sp. ChiQUE01b]|uniref:class I SAM-dependent methyltransferase n=1 Tax=Nostoc sp. ChiQUE01b TaxID=3075376 RepID=UPI002AD34597|nr:class I SAM-dependent methyltransferase [Nostoc sp. ChiQUE01b]MDZ8257273.1 class I SAM-dependent methyltransferase [Nostoc sp. ChiQUE01b]
MSSENRFSDYDAIERIYLPARKELYEIYLEELEKLILQHLPKGAHIFDFCCGRGELAQLLIKKGYQVTGLDGSEVMLRCARENAPSAEFILDDARYFKLPPTFHAVVFIGNSLNDIISIEELESVFRNLYVALLRNGLFVFELKLEEYYTSSMSVPTSRGDVENDFAWIERYTYDPQKKVAQENFTKFQLIKEEWHRSDVTFLSKAYSQTEVQSVLEKVGFTEISIYDEERDLGVDRSPGIACFVCRKP